MMSIICVMITLRLKMIFKAFRMNGVSTKRMVVVSICRGGQNRHHDKPSGQQRDP